MGRSEYGTSAFILLVARHQEQACNPQNEIDLVWNTNADDLFAKFALSGY